MSQNINNDSGNNSNNNPGGVYNGNPAGNGNYGNNADGNYGNNPGGVYNGNPAGNGNYGNNPGGTYNGNGNYGNNTGGNYGNNASGSYNGNPAGNGYYGNNAGSSYNGDPKKTESHKNVYLVCIAIVTLICIIFGSVIHILGSYRGFTNLGFRNLDLGNVVDHTIALEPFTDLKVNAAVLDFVIEYGDSYEMQFIGNEKLEPEAKITGAGTLEITQKTTFDIDLGVNSNLNSKCILVIPRDSVLGDVNLEVDVSNLEMNSLSMNTLTIDADCGNVILKDFVIQDDFNVDADCGNVEIHNSSFKKSTIDADCGSIIIESCSFESAKTNADLGNIMIEDCDFISAAADADLGNIEIGNNFSNVEAICSMGAISITSDDLTDDKLDLETDMGTVTVNGKSVGTEYHQ